MKKQRTISFTIGADVSCYADLQVDVPAEIKNKDLRAWIIEHADFIRNDVTLEPTWESFAHRLVLAEIDGEVIAEGVPLDCFASNVPVTDIARAREILEACENFLSGFLDDDINGGLSVALTVNITDMVRVLKGYEGGIV